MALAAMVIFLISGDKSMINQLDSDGKPDYSTTAEAFVEIKHISIAILAVLHSISVNLLARSKVRDASI